MTRDRYLRLPEVIHRTGLSRSTIERRARAGTFPRSHRLGLNAIAWLESDIVAWMAAPLEWKDAA